MTAINFMFTPLGSFVKSQCEHEPDQNWNSTMHNFFSVGQDQMIRTTGVKAHIEY